MDGCIVCGMEVLRKSFLWGLISRLNSLSRPGDGKNFPRNPRSEEMLARLAKELVKLETNKWDISAPFPSSFNEPYLNWPTVLLLSYVVSRAISQGWVLLCCHSSFRPCEWTCSGNCKWTICTRLETILTLRFIVLKKSVMTRKTCNSDHRILYWTLIQRSCGILKQSSCPN